MDLKELLGEELYNQVTEKAGEHKINITSDGNWIPKSKFDSVNNEKNTLKGQLDDLNKDIQDLEGKVKAKEDVDKTLADLRQTLKDNDLKMAQLKKDSAIKVEALKSNPIDIDDIIPHINKDSITVNDDGITGLKEQLEKLQETKAYLFKAEQPQGTGGTKGNNAKGGTPPSSTSFIDTIRAEQAKR